MLEDDPERDCDVDNDLVEFDVVDVVDAVAVVVVLALGVAAEITTAGGDVLAGDSSTSTVSQMVNDSKQVRQ